MGTVKFTATLDARRVLTVITTMEMLVSVAQSYGHTFTVEQQTMLSDTAKVCERDSLIITQAKD